MTILTNENEIFLEKAIQNGIFQSRVEAINEGIKLLKQKQEILNHIDEGINQIKEGNAVLIENEEGLRSFFETIKQKGRK